MLSIATKEEIKLRILIALTFTILIVSFLGFFYSLFLLITALSEEGIFDLFASIEFEFETLSYQLKEIFSFFIESLKSNFSVVLPISAISIAAVFVNIDIPELISKTRKISIYKKLL